MKLHWFFKVGLVFLSLFLVWVIFYFIIPLFLPSQKISNSEVYGLVLSDQVWEGEVRIVGDIFSPNNSTITIMPGTKVLVSIKGDKSNLDFLPWHRKNGVNTGDWEQGVSNGEPFWDETEKIQIHLNKVLVLGEVANPVIIASDSVNPSPYDFNVLSIRSGEINYAKFSNYRRFLIGPDVVIRNSSFKDTGECSLCLYAGKPQVLKSTFENSLRESIWIERASPLIEDNLFINLEGDGIRIDSKRISAPLILNNTFEMPQGIAIEISSAGRIEEGVIARNIFSGNSEIQIACDTKIRITDNLILARIGFSNGCDGGFIFGPNFWGTPDTKSIINEKIINKYDKFSIEIPSTLLSPPKDVGRR